MVKHIQAIRRQKPTNCLSVFDHFVGLWLKGCVRYIFASLFCISKREHLRNKEKCFLFHFESSSRS